METRIHTVPSGDVALHVRDMGPEDAPPILLVHGWAQYHGCWARQAPLAGEFRLVAMDLRGHGASDAPGEPAAYSEAAPWAADLAAVIAALALDRPVLVGWSYGARVIASHLQAQGDGAVAGVVLVGGILATGTAREPWMSAEPNPALDRDLYTGDLPRRLAATARFVDACMETPLDRQSYGEMVGASMLCPAHVRRAMFAGDHDLRPALSALGRPGLAIHGERDRIVAPAVGAAAARIMPAGRLAAYSGIGHAPFMEAPERFNADLAGFAREARAT